MKKAQAKVDPIPFTLDGFNKLKEERTRLLSERPEAVMHLKKAREMGDLSENGYYKSSRWKLSQIDSRLRYLNHMLRYGKIIESKKSDSVELGSTVVLFDGSKEVTYQIVGGEESNPSQGSISYKSPLGKALLGKKINEKVQFHAPVGIIVYLIKAIS
ncbi:MAG TPA: transcription elongation factor GreA [Patescibacteria group bacterium]|nr:transcription elongation factor GreA [Patescibacteria group bacterium]